jgi:hypothetical protein
MKAIFVRKHHKNKKYCNLLFRLERPTPFVAGQQIVTDHFPGYDEIK